MAIASGNIVPFARTTPKLEPKPETDLPGVTLTIPTHDPARAFAVLTSLATAAELGLGVISRAPLYDDLAVVNGLTDIFTALAKVLAS